MSDKLSSPHLPFRVAARVYSTDLGLGERLDVGGCLRFMDRGRVEAIEELCREAAEGSWLRRFMVNVYRLDAVFDTPARLGDRLLVSSGLHRRTSHRAAFEHRITNEAGGVVADATIEILFVDGQGHLAPVPAELASSEDDHLVEGCTLVPQEGRFTPRRLAPKFPFCRRFRVYYEDTDTQGIAYHVTYVRYCEQAIMELIDERCAVGESLKDWLVANPVRFRRLTSSYLKACRLGDTLEVQVRVKDLESHHVLLEVRLLKIEDPQVVSTNILMELAFFNASGDLREVPEAFVKLRGEQ